MKTKHAVRALGRYQCLFESLHGGRAKVSEYHGGRRGAQPYGTAVEVTDSDEESSRTLAAMSRLQDATMQLI